MLSVLKFAIFKGKALNNIYFRPIPLYGVALKDSDKAVDYLFFSAIALIYVFIKIKKNTLAQKSDRLP